MTTNHFIKRTMLAACCLLTLTAGAFAGTGLPITGTGLPIIGTGLPITGTGLSSTGTDITISDKLLQAFQQTFPDASQVKWVEEPESYQVTFRQNNILTKVEYDKEGHFVSSLRYYSEKNLPVSVICQLQKKYAGKSVWGVTELSTESSTEYYVKLVDDNNWYTVRSDAEGNMMTVEKYKKI